VRENCIAKPGSKLTGLSIVYPSMAKPIEMQKNAIELDLSMPLFIPTSSKKFVHNDHIAQIKLGCAGHGSSADVCVATNRINRAIHVDPDVGIRRDKANVLPTF